MRKTLTTEEITQLAHVHRRTVYRWAHEGKIETIDGSARRCIYDAESVYKFLYGPKWKMVVSDDE